MFIAEHFDVLEIIVEVIDAPRSIAEESDLRLTIAEHFSALLRLQGRQMDSPLPARLVSHMLCQYA